MARRDWRAGELNLLLFAIVLAVAALTSVSFLSDRMRLGLERDARNLIGADVVIVADTPLDAAFAERARADGLQLARTAAFPSMATVEQHGGNRDDAPARLASLKAVEPGYPLRGTLETTTDPATDGAPTRDTPAPGTVWVDRALLSTLNLKIGDALLLGTQRFTIDRVITREDDRGTGFMNFAPRVMLPMADLPATGLIGYGSRVTYRLLVAGETAAVARYRAWAEGEIDARKLRGVRLESLESGQPQLRQTLDRAERFLSLVALLAAMIAAVAIAMAARRYMQRHTDACAIYKCLGLRRRDILLGFAVEFLLVGLGAALLGVALGYASHYVLLLSLGDLMKISLPQPSLWPALSGLASGLVLLAGFAMPPLLALTRVAPLRVLRRDVGVPPVSAWLAYGLGLGAFTGLLLVAARDLKMGALTAGGFLAAMLIFAVLAAVLLTVLGRVLRGRRIPLGWRFALAVVERRRGITVLQTVALAIGLMALLLLGITRHDLVNAWRSATPADAPNRFIINIQPDQRAPLQAALQNAGLRDGILFPMIRGRLTHINDKAVDPDAYQEDRARRLVDREFNLSYGAELPAQNSIIAGRWFAADVPNVREASMEEGIATTLGVKLGDRLRFDIAGQMVEAPVTSLRKLDWSSMRVNFFVIFSPAAMQNMPETWITAFHLPPAQAALDNSLIHDYPNITIVNTELILRQVQAILDQVIAAVEFLFLFTLAAGIVVLYAALSGARDERRRDAGLLRALGASGALVRQIQVAEFLIVGGLAGLMAGSGALTIGWALANFVFEFPYHFNLWILPAGIAAGMLCAFAGGWPGLREVLRQPALATLREG
ncbi:FtsX-like permease family protein [Imbroritus primus]|uniref:FtsX-like permease family protein n=2 Tax=Imbroritus primus TaxID=3058603 RepID=A0ACD3SRR8_9BURK|nr:FtsX-like permease family protein [Burkholderiaceae bacterium PBA]